jgi:hypothetical protein
MARHAARRDEKPRPGHCRTGNTANRIDIWLNSAKIAAAAKISKLAAAATQLANDAARGDKKSIQLDVTQPD